MLTNVVSALRRETYTGDPEGYRRLVAEAASAFELDPEVRRQGGDARGGARPRAGAARPCASRLRRARKASWARRAHAQAWSDTSCSCAESTSKWMDHLRAIDALRHGIGLRGYAQKRPEERVQGGGLQALREAARPPIEDDVTGPDPARRGARRPASAEGAARRLRRRRLPEPVRRRDPRRPAHPGAAARRPGDAAGAPGHAPRARLGRLRPDARPGRRSPRRSRRHRCPR